MEHKLFRKEVVEAQANRWLGHINVATPFSLKIGAALISASAIILTLFLIFGSYTRRESALGTVVSSKGIVNVRASAGGEIGAINVAEGDEVLPGVVLAALKTDGFFSSEQRLSTSLNSSLADQQQEIEAAGSLSTERSVMRLRALDQSREIAIQRRLQALAELEIYRREADERTRQVAKVAPIVSTGYLSESQYREMRAQLAMAQASVERQRSLTLQLEQEIFKLEEERRSEEYSVKLDERERSVRLLQIRAEATRNAASGDLQLRASQEGTVAAVLVKPGEIVSAGQLIAIIVPAESRMELELMVPSESVGFVNVGAPVNIKFDSFPYEKFGLQKGVVSFVSTAPIPASQSGSSESRFIIRVALRAQQISTRDGPKVLLPGMAARASLLLDRRNLYEWILRPAYKLPEANNE